MANYENYEIIEITREQIKNAPYNPRKIKAEAQKQNDELRKTTSDKLSQRENPEFYCVLVFSTFEMRNQFLDIFGLEHDKFQNGNDIFDLINQG